MRKLILMKFLIRKIEELKKSNIKKIVDLRINEFESMSKSSSEKIFNELCFCILTANFNAEKAIHIQEKIGNGFSTLPKHELAKKLKELGHRFPNKRAEYIVEARKKFPKLMKIFHNNEIREWLVKNIKGVGYKEASHFLRNIGYEDFAIIDFHILDILSKNKIIKKPKTLTKKKYLEIEQILRKIAQRTSLTLGELDLYLWYLETGKVLK